MLAIEFGWFLTEMGRQPWIVRGYMRVAEAATQAGGITFVTILFWHIVHHFNVYMHTY